MPCSKFWQFAKSSFVGKLNMALADCPAVSMLCHMDRR